MRKNIIKKVLATLLSIAMAVGATQLMPIVSAAPITTVDAAAAEVYYYFPANINDNTSDYKYRMTFKKFSSASRKIDLSYNGKNQLPQIDGEVAIVKWNAATSSYEPYDSLKLPAGYFKITPVDELGNALSDYSDASTSPYYCKLEIDRDFTSSNPSDLVSAYNPSYELDNSGSLSDKQSKTWFKYYISQVGIQSLTVTVANDGIVLLENPDASGDVTPEISSVVAKFMNGQSKALDPSEYSVTKLKYNDSGEKQIVVTVAADDNHGAKTSSSIPVVAAYPLNNLPTGYSVVIDGNPSLSTNDSYITGYAAYTGISIPVKLTITNGPNKADTLPENLVTTYEKDGVEETEVKYVGTYKVTLAPTSDYSTVTWSGTNEMYVTGSASTTFKVNGIDAENLKVYYDFDGVGPNPAEEITSVSGVVLNYEAGSPAEFDPAYLYVEAPAMSNAHITFTVGYLGNTSQTGSKRLVITPTGDAAKVYTGTKEIVYFVKSPLHFENYYFQGDSTPNATSMPFNGQARYLSTYVVKGEGNTVINSNYYRISYQYYDSTTNDWYPKRTTTVGGTTLVEGYTPAEMASPTTEITEKMASSGAKRVLITGLESFLGATGELRYDISTVTMGDSSPDGTFTVEFGKYSAADPLKFINYEDTKESVYDGLPKEPGVRVTYTPSRGGGTPVVLTDGTGIDGGDYTVSYSNNINAGNNTAVVTITGKGTYGGTLTKTFSIKKVKFTTDLPIDVTQPFTGSPQAPSIVLSTPVTASVYGSYTLKETDYIIESVKKGIEELSASQWPTDATGAGYYVVVLRSNNTTNIGSEGEKLTIHLKITEKALTPDMFQLNGADVNSDSSDPIVSVTWDGTEMKPTISIKAGSDLTEDEYEIVGYKYKNLGGTEVTTGATGAGIGTVQVKGKGNYSSTPINLTYKVLPRSLANGEITQTMNALGTTVPTVIDLRVIDSTSGTRLNLNTDFKIKAVYPKDNPAGALSLGAGGYTEGTNQITIAQAGLFDIEIEGIGNYTGSPISACSVTCGVNLADYYVYIKGTYRKQYFIDDHLAGTVSTPGTCYELRKIDNGSTDYSSSVAHTLCYYNTSTKQDGDDINVGRVYVQGEGVPASGTFGKTTLVVDEDGIALDGTYFTINPAIWNPTGINDSKWIKIDVNYSPSKDDYYYTPNRTEAGLPNIVVSYDKTGTGLSFATLEKDEDYKIYYTYKESGIRIKTDSIEEAVAHGALNAGTHQFIIEGIGNYSDSRNKREGATCQYTIKPATIKASWISKSASVSYVSDEAEFSVYYDGTGEELEAGVDFKVTGPVDKNNHTERVYTIETLNGSNYTVDGGKIDIVFPIEKTDLSSLSIKNSRDEAAPGDAYVVWRDDNSSFISDHYKKVELRSQAQPNFSLMYVKGDGTVKELILDTDYKLGTSENSYADKYGANNTVGLKQDSNYVRISGTGGFTGTVDLPCTLYYPLTQAQITSGYLKVTSGAGLIYPSYTDGGETVYATVTQKDFEEWLTNGTLAEKVSMKFDIASDSGLLTLTAGTDYEVSVVGTTTGIGSKIIRVTGKEDSPNYFKGHFDFTIKTTGDLSDAIVTVCGNTENQVQFKGRNIVKEDLELVVRMPGESTNLQERYLDADSNVCGDYVVKDINQPSSSTGLGVSTITLEGINKYAGTSIIVEYTVVAHLRTNEFIKYEILGSDNNWYEYNNTISPSVITYRYANGSDDEPGVRPDIRVKIGRITSAAGDPVVIDWSRELTGIKFTTSISDSTGYDYSVSYSYNTKATNAARIEFASGTDSYLWGSKDLTFMIAKTPLEESADSTIHVTFNSPVEYNGQPIDQVNGLNLEVTDSNCTGEGQILRYGVDYTLEFDSDHTNVKAGVIGTIKATDTGNYTGRRTISFTITRKSLTTDMITNPVTMTYTGKPIPVEKIGPKIVLEQGGTYTRTLEYGDLKDFKIVNFILPSGSLVSVDNPPTEVGNYKIRLEGVGNYKDTVDIDYEITVLDLADANVEFFPDLSGHCPVDVATLPKVPSCVYDGTAHEPNVGVTYEGEILEKGVDYELVYSNNIDAGTATVRIQALAAGGSGNYGGYKDVEFEIKPKDITDLTLIYSTINENYPFALDGSNIPVAQHPGDTLVIKDSQIADAAGYKVLATGVADSLGNFPAGTDYSIAYISENNEQEEIDGAPHESYAGEVKMIVTGRGNYTGTKEYVYYIGECLDAAVPVLDASMPGTTYNGLKQEPIISSVNKNGLTFSDDQYEIKTYRHTIDKKNLIDKKDIIDADTYYITVSGKPSKGTYSKNPNKTCVFIVAPRSIAGCEVSGYDGMYYYTGKEICPRGIIVTDTKMPVSLASSTSVKSVQLISGIDYDIGYKNNRNAGKAEIVVTGLGNYTGTVYGYFTIDSSKVSGGDSYDESSAGTGIIDAGEYSIAPSDIHLTFDTTGNNYMKYTGSSVKPSITISDGNGGYISNSNFYITAENSVNPGIATLVITGNGTNFTGTIKIQYLIKADLSKYGKFAAIADQVYTGTSIKPTVTLSCGSNVLREGSDYTLSYTNNTNIGKATVYADAITGANSYYYGRVSTEFNISNTATGMQVSGYASSYQYTGAPIVPDVAVTMNGRSLVKGKDFSVTFANNTNVGTATITVTGIGNYSGTKKVNFAIVARNIENCSTTNLSNVEYSGSSYTPNVVVSDISTGRTLVKGSDYTITYSNNTKPGTAKVTIQGLGSNYTGSKTITFKITAAAVTGVKTSSVQNHSMKLSWDSQAYASGYQICNSENRVIANTTKTAVIIKRLASCKTYQYKVRSYVDNADGSRSYGEFSSLATGKTILNTPKLRARAYGSGAVLLRWSKIKKAQGYDIFYSTSKNGTYYKLATISKSENRVFLDKGLAKGEVYYYTIRAYKTVNGTKTYSNYYTIQKVTVK